jgi:cell division protease FtsH
VTAESVAIMNQLNLNDTVPAGRLLKVPDPSGAWNGQQPGGTPYPQAQPPGYPPPQAYPPQSYPPQQPYPPQSYPPQGYPYPQNPPPNFPR